MLDRALMCLSLNNCLCIITVGSKAKKMKLTVKGGAAVDPDSGTWANPTLNESSLSFLSSVFNWSFLFLFCFRS